MAKFNVAWPIALAQQEPVLAALPETDRAAFLETLEMVANSCASMSLHSLQHRPKAGNRRQRKVDEGVPGCEEYVADSDDFDDLFLSAWAAKSGWA